MANSKKASELSKAVKALDMSMRAVEVGGDLDPHETTLLKRWDKLKRLLAASERA